MRGLEMPQTCELRTPSGHIISGSFNPTTERFECHLLHKDTGEKLAVTQEVAAGITAAVRAQAVAKQAQDKDDDWHQTICQLKAKQAQYLNQLAGVAADMILEKRH